MKILISVIFSLLFTPAIYSQTDQVGKIIPSSKSEFEACKAVGYLKHSIHVSKLNGLFSVMLNSGSSLIFRDTQGDDKWIEYVYIGEINNSDFSLISMTGFNDSNFLLLNRNAGTLDTLIGRPVFSADYKYFACFNNPGTDEKSIIQLFEFSDSKAIMIKAIDLREQIIISDIRCISKNSLLARDHINRYWNISIR